MCSPPYLSAVPKENDEKKLSKIAQRIYAPAPGPLAPIAPSGDNRMHF